MHVVNPITSIQHSLSSKHDNQVTTQIPHIYDNQVNTQIPHN